MEGEHDSWGHNIYHVGGILINTIVETWMDILMGKIMVMAIHKTRFKAPSERAKEPNSPNKEQFRQVATRNFSY